MTTQLHTLGSTIAAQVGFMPFLANMLCEDIDASMFANRHGTTINHPAFVLGHISYYIGKCLALIGSDDPFCESEAALYAMGVECVDDASLYPDKQTCIAHFATRCQDAAKYVESCDPTLFERSAAETPFAERFDTLGQVASFMLIGHPSFHLGQISAWRRVAGMGSTS